MAEKTKKVKDYLWHDRKRTFLGLPLSFTLYLLDEDKLYIRTGFFNSREDEVRLYRITDVTLLRSFGQKLLGIGTIHCDSADVTLRNFDIVNVRHPKQVKEMLSELVDQSRMRNRVFTSESVNALPHDHDGDGVQGVDLDGDGIPDAPPPPPPLN